MTEPTDDEFADYNHSEEARQRREKINAVVRVLLPVILGSLGREMADVMTAIARLQYEILRRTEPVVEEDDMGDVLKDHIDHMLRWYAFDTEREQFAISADDEPQEFMDKSFEESLDYIMKLASENSEEPKH